MITRSRGFLLWFVLAFFTILIFYSSFSSRNSVTSSFNVKKFIETQKASLCDGGEKLGLRSRELFESTSQFPSVLQITKCTDKPLRKYAEQRGEFYVFYNYVMADRSFGCDESVTLTAPGDYRFLDNVIPLVDRWQGPISVALYAPGDDFFTTLQAIAYLRTCETALIREYVTFHVFFENEHLPDSHGIPLFDIYEDEYDCDTLPPWENVTDDEMYKAKHSLLYPINVARNVAKVSAQTHFVFPSDIELYPTRNFIPIFLDFVRRRQDLFFEDQNNVFVLPIFEILEDQQVPENKTALKKMLKTGKAILFHQSFCSVCHRVPQSDLWIKANETQVLDIFSVGKRQGKYAVWEPFYVCTQKEPLWDERLSWEGQGNKMSQAYNLCLLEYDFQVFNNAFLIHKPGVKKKKVQNIKHKDQQKISNKMLIKIADELQAFYGVNDKCRVHNIYR